MYQDIDLSFRSNTQGDVAVLTDANAIKASIYNRLLIGNPELYFVNGQKQTVSDFLFEENDFLTRDNIKEMIKDVVSSDDRIAGIDFLAIRFSEDNNRYEIDLSFTLKTNTVRSTDNRTTSITLFLNKQ
jgi:hypothetical protein